MDPQNPQLARRRPSLALIIALSVGLLAITSAAAYTLYPGNNSEVEQLRADLAAAEAELETCRETVRIVAESATLFSEAFDKQLDITLNAALYGLSDQLVADQDAVTDIVGRAADLAETAEQC